MALLEKVIHITFFGVYLAVSSRFIINAEKNVKSSDPNVRVVGELTYRFLTNWTYGMQLFYYMCMVIVHLLSVVPFLNKINNKLRSFADILFTTIVIPFGLVVTLSFWSLYTIDRELVYPSWLDKVIPLWMNHALHTFNSILPLIDMLFTNHKFASWSITSIGIMLYSLAYAVCFFGTYYTHGRWLYPMFEKLSYPEMGLYCLGNVVAAFLLHTVARFTCKFIWGTPTQKPKPKKSKHKTKKVA